MSGFTGLVNGLSELTRPRLWPLLAAIAIVGAVATYLEVRIYPRARELFTLETIAANDNEEYHYVTYELARLQGLKPADGPLVAVIGGSSAREALDWPAAVQLDLCNRLGTKLQFVNLSSSGQTLTQSLSVMDNLPDRPGTVIYVGVNLGRLTGNLETATAEYLAEQIPFLRLEALGQLIRDAGGVASWYPNVLRHRSRLAFFIEQRASSVVRSALKDLFGFKWSRELLRSLVSEKWFEHAPGTPIPYTKRFFYNAPLTTVEKKKLADARGYFRVAQFASDLEFSRRTVSAMAALAKRRGMKLVFLDLPQDPFSIALHDSQREVYDSVLHAGDALGAVFVDWKRRPEFSAADFHDLVHFVPATRTKFFPMFVELVRSDLAAQGH